MSAPRILRWMLLPLAAFARELEAFDVSTGAIRFQPDEPLPPGLVRRIVQARIREDEPL